MLADELHRFTLAVYNVQEASWGTGFREEISEDHGCTWYTFRRLQDGGVPACDRYRKRPKWYHGGKVEGTNGCRNTEGNFVRDDIHVRGDVARGLAHLEHRDRRACIDDLCGNIQLNVMLNIIYYRGDDFWLN